MWPLWAPDPGVLGGDRIVTLVEFTIPGEPLPKQRPRSKNGQQPFTPKVTRDAEKRVAAAFTTAHPEWTLLDGPVRVWVDFHRRTYRAVDVDNLLKLVTDALNGIAWVDDKQITDLRGVRLYGARDDARTVVHIHTEGATP